MLDKEISRCCKDLRLSQNLAEVAQTTEGGTHQEYLYRLLHSELEYREKSRIAKHIKGAGFYSIKTFDAFRFDEVTLPTDTSPEQLKALEFMEDRKNIIMYGRTGTGKTMLSTAIGVEACRKGYRVKFCRTASLVNQLSEAKSVGKLSSFLKKLKQSDLIILDEWGYIPYDRTGAQLLFDFLSEIHEHKSVVLNTNLEFSRWVNVLYDEQMTAALVGRLMHNCLLLLFPGENNRMRESSISGLYQPTRPEAPVERGTKWS